jgi:hypothetical protein
VGPPLSPSSLGAAHRSEPWESAAMAATLGIPANATCTAVAVDALALMPTLDSTSRMMKVLQPVQRRSGCWAAASAAYH